MGPKMYETVDPKDLIHLGRRIWDTTEDYDVYGDGSKHGVSGPIHVHAYRHRTTKELIVIPCGQESKRYVDFFVAERGELSRL